MEMTDKVSGTDYVHCFAVTGKGRRCGQRRRDDHSPYCGTHAAASKRGRVLALVEDYEFWLWQRQFDLPSWAYRDSADIAELERDNERKAAEAAGAVGVPS